MDNSEFNEDVARYRKYVEEKMSSTRQADGATK